MNSTTTPSPADTPDDEDDSALQDHGPACMLVFNANDCSGAGGLSADISAAASVGGHALPVVTGTYVRDSARIFDHFALDAEAVAEQARAVLEDIPVQIIKVGFVGDTETIATVAGIAADYEDTPVVAYMPDLSWWSNERIEAYLDAFRDMLLPQTTVLVGNHSTLSRWLLPDWTGRKPPTARDIAGAAGDSGVAYTLVTGIPLPGQFVDNVLASPQTVVGSAKFELFEATFSGAGDTLSAALAALLADGLDLAEATSEALQYLDQCLDGGFRPGMGQVLPDRLAWADQDGDDGPEEEAGEADDAGDGADGLALPEDAAAAEAVRETRRLIDSSLRNPFRPPSH
jgi:hydroxymethylpyrimidine/phosphomethylpyrimidine kinase